MNKFLILGVLVGSCSAHYYPLIIVGGGVAGYSAAIYGGNARIPTLLIKGPYVGGQLAQTDHVENMPAVDALSGIDIIERLEHQALYFGAELVYDTVVSCKVTPNKQFMIVTESGQVYTADAVIAVSGASPKMLDIPGEQRYWGRGISTCALCDCFSTQDKHIVIIGGGDTAIEEAIQLAPYATRITLLVRGSGLRASMRMQEKLREYEHIACRFNTAVQEVLGDVHMDSVRVRNVITGEIEDIRAQGLFLAIGQKPDTDWLAGTAELDDQGYIKLIEHQKTSCPGIFAAGSAVDRRYRQAGVASGDGIKAALDAIAYLRGIEA